MSHRDELYARKQAAMKLRAAGYSWQAANEQSELAYSRQGIQRLYRAWQARGDEALADNRHGHVSKASAEVRGWLVERCETAGEVPSPQLVAEIKSRFGVALHHDYVNLLRQQLGLPAPRPGRPGKKETGPAAPDLNPEAEFSP
jgi:transposase